jgi:hypothetical protein
VTRHHPRRIKLNPNEEQVKGDGWSRDALEHGSGLTSSDFRCTRASRRASRPVGAAIASQEGPNYHRQAKENCLPCRHHSLLILNVMDVHGGTFPMRWQRAPDFEKQLAIPAQASSSSISPVCLFSSLRGAVDALRVTVCLDE